MRPESTQTGDLDELPMRLGQVASLIALGYSDKQIARELNLSTRTVHRHVVRLLDRLQVENRAAVAAIWVRGTRDGEQSTPDDDVDPMRWSNASSTPQNDVP
jgi:DNA-binding NarL/FixJ family response regulator